MRDIVRGENRFRTVRDGIETLHSFSFGEHYDPERVGFGPLVAINEERLAPGTGYPSHPHSDCEIVTWVVDGTLDHRDSIGTDGAVEAGTIGWLRAGTGVEHTEFNASPTRDLTFLQMVVRADGDEPVQPSHDATELPVACLGSNVLLVVVGHQRIPPTERTLVHVVRGTVRVGGSVLHAGDELMADEPLGRLGCDDTSLALVWLLGTDVRVINGQTSTTIEGCLSNLDAVLEPHGQMTDLDDVARELERQVPELDHDVTIFVLDPDLMLSDEPRPVQRQLEDLMNLAVARSQGRLHFVVYAPAPSTAIRASWR